MSEVRDKRRRPQWRGDRRAILVRLPVEEANRLCAEATRQGASVSDLAGKLIRSGLDTKEHLT